MQSDLEEMKSAEADADSNLKTAKKEHAKRNRTCGDIEKVRRTQPTQLTTPGRQQLTGFHLHWTFCTAGNREATGRVG